MSRSTSSSAATNRGEAEAAAASAGMTGEFRKLLAAVEEFIDASTTMTGEQLAQAREQVRTRLVAARADLATASENTIERARHSAVVADEYVRQQPWAAVGASLAIGFLAGAMCSRRD